MWFFASQEQARWSPRLANPAELLRTVAHLAEAGRTDLEWIEGIVDDAEKDRIERAPDGIRFKIDGVDTDNGVAVVDSYAPDIASAAGRSLLAA